MDYVIYFILDCLDTLAIYLLMMTIFQYPIREYLREIMIICATLGVSSLLIREVIGFISIDPMVHILLLVLCLRYIIKVRLYRAIVITATGTLAYFAIQAVISLSGTIGDFLLSSDLYSSHSRSVQVIQLISQAITFLLAFLVSKHDLGVTKFVRPPHDFYIINPITKNQMRLLLTSITSLIIISIAFYYSVFHHKVVLFTMLALILCLLVFILTYRRDRIVSGHRSIEKDNAVGKE